MEDEHDATGDLRADVPPTLEDGLAAAFGPRSDRETVPSPSVLDRLASASGIRPRMTLRDDPQTADRLVRPLRRDATEGNAWLAVGSKYQVQGELARGGVGVVLKGHDVDLGRDVAMKVLHEKYRDDPDLVQRFVEEAQIGGQLQHPGIVPVYDLGLGGDRPYFTMKLIKGRTFAALLEERRDAHADRRRMLGIFEQVCQTMAYAHARGVIHRDLKPANVMVGAFGEVQVVDWGMGKVLTSGGTADEERSRRRAAQSVIETVRSRPGSGSSHSIVGSVMGTPAYMPPEQANGDVEHMDERSDVFALGAILCEILTGRPPYVGEPEDLLGMAAKARLDPCRKRLEASGVDPQLGELCNDCLAAAPALRPRHAGVVAERLAAHLSDTEDRARRAQVEAAEERVRTKAARRAQRLTVALAASVVVTLGVGAGGAWWVEAAARERESAADARVVAVLHELGPLLGEARASGAEDLTLWESATAAAERAVGLARDEDVSEARRGEVRELRALVEREHVAARRAATDRERDERMHERLTQLRNPYEEGLRWPKQPREAARLDASYDEAFREYLGSDPADAGPEAAIALAASRDPVGLAVAIDHWALVRDSREGERDAAFDARTARLRRLAASVDGEDPWRNDLRSLLPDVESNREALQDLARTARLSELPPISIVLLGEALWAAEARDDAVAVYRRGRELHPGDFGISLRLARMLYDVDDHRLLPEVIDVLHSARALRSFEHEIAHLEIVVLHRMGRYDDAQRLAEDTFQLVLARKWPWEDALAHRAWALAKLERWEDLIEVNRRRLEILESEEKPVLGHVVGALDSTVEALEALGRLDEAIATARRGLEVVAVYEAAVEAGEQQPHERAADAEETFNEAIERIDARREELPVLEAILDGRRAAGSPEQALAAADVAYVRRHFELSVRTMARVFVEQPGSEADHRFEAACRAALCGTGRGEDAAALDPTEREAWRRQALAWLRAELDAERERGVRAPRGTASRLEGWRTDPDLAGIRDESELAALPHEERGALRELWADVEVLAANLSDPP